MSKIQNSIPENDFNEIKKYFSIILSNLKKNIFYKNHDLKYSLYINFTDSLSNIIIFFNNNEPNNKKLFISFGCEPYFCPSRNCLIDDIISLQLMRETSINQYPHDKKYIKYKIKYINLKKLNK